MANDFTGSKYDRDLDVTEIAKRVRKDIRAAVKAGGLPMGTKTSVRISRFAGGCSLSVWIKELPGIAIMNVRRMRLDIEEPHACHMNRDPEQMELYSADGKRVKALVEGIVDAYLRDRSDSMTDYFCVNFYGSVDFEHDLEEEEREMFKVACEQAAKVVGGGRQLSVAFTVGDVVRDKIGRATSVPYLRVIDGG